jgi:hypothetical protein
MAYFVGIRSLNSRVGSPRPLYFYFPHLNFAETLWRKTKYEWLQFKDYNDAETLRDALQTYGTSYRINTL